MRGVGSLVWGPEGRGRLGPARLKLTAVGGAAGCGSVAVATHATEGMAQRKDLHLRTGVEEVIPFAYSKMIPTGISLGNSTPTT